MAKHSDNVLLSHIAEAIDKIRALVNRGGRKLFEEDFAIADAIVRELAVIGEATNNLSQLTKNKYGSVPWKDTVEMRNWLIHGYAEIDWNEVWDTATRDIPELEHQIESLLKESKE